MSESFEVVLTLLWLVISPSFSEGKSKNRVFTQGFPSGHNRFFFLNSLAKLQGPNLSRIASNQETEKIPNLAQLCISYLEETTVNKVVIVNVNNLSGLSQDGSSIFALIASPLPRNLEFFSHLFRIIQIARTLESQKIPCVCFLPDTYYPDAAFISSFLASRTGGSTVILQNTTQESSLYGYANPQGLVFWPWPQSRLIENIRASIPWRTRDDVCIIPGSTYQRRIKSTNIFVQLNGKNGHLSFSQPNTELDRPDFLRKMGKAKICVTTNWVQDYFYRGPKAYQEKISETTTTGMVWEAFASGLVLIANKSKVLEELGFKVGRDYLDLDKFLAQELFLENFEDGQLQSIAQSGHVKFRSIVERDTRSPSLSE